jgi:hypothetical protein
MKAYLQMTITGILILFLCSGCVVTSNYYTGRTLSEGKFAFAMGADDIILKSTEKSNEITKKNPFTPSIILSYGLPLRLETSLRYIPTKFFEGGLRFQVNPYSFDVVDGSLNLHYGYFITSYSYLKYGVTLSKNISDFEPYVHYSAYHFINTQNVDLSSGFLSGATEEFINGNRSVGIGLGIPLKKAMIFPEINYQYYGSSTKSGLIHFGIALRTYIN